MPPTLQCGVLSRWLGVLLLVASSPAVAGEVAWGAPVKGVQYALAIVPGSGAVLAELELDVQVRNTSSVKQQLPVRVCAQRTWLSFSVLNVRVGNRVFRYPMGSLMDIASLHPHVPVELAPGEVLGERVSFKSILAAGEMNDRGSALGKLLLRRAQRDSRSLAPSAMNCTAMAARMSPITRSRMATPDCLSTRSTRFEARRMK